MKQVLEDLYRQRYLTKEESKDILKNFASGLYNLSQMASFLTVFQMRNITVEEMNGFREAMLELCIPVDFDGFDTVDLAGTGGDGKDTFNISTLASFIVAGAGVRVIKHGNYGVSSSCGSSNVLEYLGYKFSNNPDKLKKELDKTGFCFLHAPLFHPAMKNVAPVRKDLGVKTFFNMLGPLVNPGNPRNQLIGVFSHDVARLYNYIYQNLDKKYSIIHSMDGYDEISLTGNTRLESMEGSQMLKPGHFGFEKQEPEEIQGGKDVPASAELFTNVLESKGTEAQNQVALANAAVALKTVFPEKNLEETLEMAKESLHGKKALKVLKKLMEMQV